MRRTTLPPAVRKYAHATARQVRINTTHLFHDPDECEIAGKLFNRCKHGTLIDDHTDRDLMCGWCEMDVSPFDFGLASAWSRQNDVMAAVTSELLTAARRADRTGKPHTVTAKSVYGQKVDGPPISAPVWEWLTPADLVTVSVLIAALDQANRLHST